MNAVGYARLGRSGELSQLRALSAQLGTEPSLVQGSNGNTSIKDEGMLWVKASGHWLVDAARDDMFVAVPVSYARACVERSAAMEFPGDFGWGRRPSVETGMHAVIPQRVVIHVHSIQAIAWAVLRDGPTAVAERLEGLSWTWIPYSSSGLPLARSMAAAVATKPETDVFILGNHGLVVCGEDCGAAESVLWDVERRLAVAPRSIQARQQCQSEPAMRRGDWRLPKFQCVQAMALNPIAAEILRGGVLYPCQAMFLGASMPILGRRDANLSREPVGPGMIDNSTFEITEGHGVILRSTMTDEAEATLTALAQVLLRVPGSARVRYLTPGEICDVVKNDPHQYGRPDETSKRIRHLKSRAATV